MICVCCVCVRCGSFVCVCACALFLCPVFVCLFCLRFETWQLPYSYLCLHFFHLYNTSDRICPRSFTLLLSLSYSQLLLALLPASDMSQSAGRHGLII